MTSASQFVKLYRAVSIKNPRKLAKLSLKTENVTSLDFVICPEGFTYCAASRRHDYN
jgi:hypothetical protein